MAELVGSLPRDHQGIYILDSLPRNERGLIDIDVYYFDTVSGRRWMEQSPFGNLDRAPLLMGDDWHNEDHDVFNGYWWTVGNMGCDCNRGRDTCNAGPNEVIIEKITPRDMSDIILLSEKVGSSVRDRDW